MTIIPTCLYCARPVSSRFTMPATFTMPSVSEVTCSVEEGDTAPLVVRCRVVLNDLCLCGRPRRTATLFFDVPFVSPCSHATSRYEMTPKFTPLLVARPSDVAFGIEGRLTITCRTCDVHLHKQVTPEYIEPEEFEPVEVES